jgi:hypothetical protein
LCIPCTRSPLDSVSPLNTDKILFERNGTVHSRDPVDVDLAFLFLVRRCKRPHMGESLGFFGMSIVEVNGTVLIKEYVPFVIYNIFLSISLTLNANYYA